MSPSINVGDILIVAKFGCGNYGTYGVQFSSNATSEDIQIKRSKNYVFKHPFENNLYVKRLIAKPGDSVRIRGSSVRVNGKLLEARLQSKDKDYKYYTEHSDGASYRIKVSKTKHAMQNINIQVPQGQYFFLGDNRDNSSDSRLWGTVARSSIIGEVAYIF